MHIMRLFLLTLCSSAMCREIAVPCSMRRHYKDCISNDSCSWCCDSAVPGEVCRCEETSVREKRYVPPECAEAGYTGVDLCSPHNSSTEDCSGRGVCVCGKCECEIRENPKEAIFGTFCECDNFSCDRWNGVLCGGPERGVCICGECSCLATWGGTACSCSLSNETCIAPGSNSSEHCSGRGTCDCGQCTCEKTFVGIFCEEKMV